MSEHIERRDQLASFSDRRGSMVLLTERRHVVPTPLCEVCKLKHEGGLARGVVFDEPGADTPRLWWRLNDGWSQPDAGSMAACLEHQSDPLLKITRFAN